MALDYKIMLTSAAIAFAMVAVTSLVGVSRSSQLGHTSRNVSLPGTDPLEQSAEGSTKNPSAASDEVDVRRRTDNAVRAQEAKLADLEQQIATQQWTIEQLEDERLTEEGTPIKWGDIEMPPVYAPETFGEKLKAAMVECEVPAEVVEVDCSEAPCVVALRADHQQWRHNSLRNCPAWTNSMGSKMMEHRTFFACGDDAKEPYVLLSPYFDAWDAVPGVAENVRKRNRTRQNQIASNWDCATP